MQEPKTRTWVGGTNAAWAFVLSLVGVPVAPFALFYGEGSALLGIIIGGAAVALGVDALRRLRQEKRNSFLAISGTVLGVIEVAMAVTGAVTSTPM